MEDLNIMKLIEKIVDKFLDDGDYALTFAAFLFPLIMLFCFCGKGVYESKLQNDVKLAMIAAGQIAECGCEYKTNCKCR